MKSIIYLIALLIAVTPFTSHAEDKMAKEVLKPAAVMFFSANCGSCKILDPRMKEALSDINNNALDLVVFDFTNRDTISQTKILAEEKALTSVLNEYGARTGFVALVDEKGRIIDEINVGHDVDAIKAKLKTLI